MKKFALMGTLGGIVFAIGDLLVYLLPHYLSPGYYGDLLDMNIWRLAVSVYLGCFGSGLLLTGFYSLYNIIKSRSSDIIKITVLIIAFGITLTPLGHFMIVSLAKMTFKFAASSGVSVDVAKSIAKNWFTYTDPVKYFIMLIVVVLQSVMMTVLILKKIINCPKWMVLLNPLGFTLILSIPMLLLLKNTEFAGIAECFESLGEGAIYVAVYWHYKRTDNISTACSSQNCLNNIQISEKKYD